MKKIGNKIFAIVISLSLLAGCEANQGSVDADIPKVDNDVEIQSPSSNPAVQPTDSIDETVVSAETSTVYMTTDITPEGLMAVYEALGWTPNGNVAVKLSTGEQDPFLESMGEAGKAVSDYLGNGEQIVYVNVMNRLSVDCDCNGNPADPDMHDIGILASTDLVALDKACIDLVYAAEDGAALIERIESRNVLHTLEHAEQIGLGRQTYELVSIDDWRIRRNSR